MKKLLTLTVFLSLFLSLVFSSGVNAKAYRSFWKTLEDEFPLFLYAERDGIDGDEIRKEYKKEFSASSSSADMVRVFERIASEYSAYDEMDISRTLTASVSGVSIKSTGTAYSSRVTFLPESNAVVITIKSFEEEDLDIERVVSELSEIRFVSDIIIDVRGCRKGESCNLDSLLSLFGGEWSYPYRAFFRNKETALLYYKDDIIYTRSNRYGLDAYVDVTYEKSYGKGRLSSIFSEARRWLLVDSDTSYTADFLASFAVATGWATVVGENTYGNGTGVPRHVYTLGGNSGYSLTFNPCVIDNGKGGIKALTGVTPDILIKSGEDALEKCLETIGQIGNDSE